MKSTPIVSLSIIATCLLSSCGQTNTNNITQSPNNLSISDYTPDTTNKDTVDNNTKFTPLAKSATYLTDHGKHQVNTQFDISQDSNGRITGVTVTMLRGDHESGNYTRRFNSEAKTQLVGKKISDLTISTIGGASDTTDAFLSVIESL